MLDTNLFIAAYWNKRSASAAVLSACIEGRLHLYYTEQIRREIFLILRNIRARDEYRQYVDQVLASGTDIAVTSRIHVVVDDPEDDKFLECALEAHADYIVTSDDHLLRIRQFEDIRIVKPSEMRNMLAQP